MSAIPLSECKFCPHCGTPKERWPQAIYEFTPDPAVAGLAKQLNQHERKLKAAPPGPRPPRKPRKKPAKGEQQNGVQNIPESIRPIDLDPYVKQVADSFVVTPTAAWLPAAPRVLELLKTEALTTLVRAATQYRRQHSAQQAFDRQKGRPLTPPMSPEKFFRGKTWKGPFPMPEDPEVVADEEEAGLSHDEWLAKHGKKS